LNDSSAAEKGGSKANASSKDTAADGGAAKKEKKKKSKKKEDNDGMPQIKKPLSAYMLFNNARRPTLQQEYPGKYFSVFQATFEQLSLHFLTTKRGVRKLSNTKFRN